MGIVPTGLTEASFYQFLEVVIARSLDAISTCFVWMCVRKAGEAGSVQLQDLEIIITSIRNASEVVIVSIWMRVIGAVLAPSINPQKVRAVVAIISYTGVIQVIVWMRVIGAELAVTVGSQDFYSVVARPPVDLVRRIIFLLLSDTVLELCFDIKASTGGLWPSSQRREHDVDI